MLQVQLSKDSQKFLSKILQKKHSLQLKHRIESLKVEPFAIDCKALQGSLKGRYRADIGEYRIIYNVDAENGVLKINFIGKRNDAEIYKKATRAK